MSRPGRTERRVWRAFACDSRLWTTGELIREVLPRRSWFWNYQYTLVRRAAALFADPVGYERRGRCSKSPGGIVWQPKRPLPPLTVTLTGTAVEWVERARARRRHLQNL